MVVSQRSFEAPASGWVTSQDNVHHPANASMKPSVTPNRSRPPRFFRNNPKISIKSSRSGEIRIPKSTHGDGLMCWYKNSRDASQIGMRRRYVIV